MGGNFNRMVFVTVDGEPVAANALVYVWFPPKDFGEVEASNCVCYVRWVGHTYSDEL